MQRFLPCLVVSLLIATSPLLLADTLLVKRSEQAQGAAFPKRGSTMSQVEAQYGAPTEKHKSVGKPPITRWDYPAFTVYFEYNHVVDAVVRKSSASEMGVKPVAQPKQ